MITKKSAMQIYNLHSLIEKSNELIRILTECKEQYEKDSNGVDIITDQWNIHRSIELHIPDRFRNPNSHSLDSATIHQISVPDAILVLQNHVVRLNKALEEENRKIMDECTANI